MRYVYISLKQIYPMILHDIPSISHFTLLYIYIYIYITYPITYHKFLPYIPLSNYNPLYNYIPSQYIPTISPVYPDHILVIPICTYPYYILIISLFYIITYIPLYPHNPVNDPKYA